MFLACTRISRPIRAEYSVSSRNRSRTLSEGSGGNAVPIASGLSPQNGVARTRADTCADVVGNRNAANPLTITHKSNWKWAATGRVATWWDTFQFVRTQDVYNHQSMPGGSPSDNTALAMGLARTNPNKSSIDVPVFVLELGDLPRMVRDWGRVLLKKPHKIASGKDLRTLPRSVSQKYIEWTFGLDLLIRDVATLLDVQGQVDRKVKTLKRLGDPLATSSSAKVWSGRTSSAVTSQYATTLFQEHRMVHYRNVTDFECWVSTKWKPAIPLPTSDHELRQRAFRLVYGLDISISTLWEAMPWSWLIDWFSDVGDVLAANRNSIPVTHGGSCIMRQSISHTEVDHLELPVVGDTLSLIHPPYMRVDKTRTVMGDAAPRLELNLPFLSGKQLSILSALAVLKGSNFR
jgi:hypothetical protein